MSEGPHVANPFDLDAFLAMPLVARVATTGPAGPTVRPVWYLWEEGAFWWLTGPWSRLPTLLAADPTVALVVDSCDLETGATRQVTAKGRAEVVAADPARSVRKLSRYLGPDVQTWDDRFAAYVSRPDAVMARLVPDRLVAKDLSFRPSQ